MGNDVRGRVDGMIDYIKTGRILDAMTEFYHEDAAMQENGKPATKGLAANIEREKQFLAHVKDFKGFGASSIGIEGGAGGTGTALVESWMAFVNTDGQDVRMEQVSVQRWRGGKIEHERFYYDSGA